MYHFIIIIVFYLISTINYWILILLQKLYIFVCFIIVLFIVYMHRIIK